MTSRSLLSLKGTVAADKLNQQYGTWVNAHPGEMVQNYDGPVASCTSRYDCDPPIRGGSLIKREGDNGPCTTAFVVENATMNDGVNYGAMVMTAGHCNLNQQGWKSANGHMGSTKDHYGDVGGTTVNADVMFINIDNAEDSNDVIDHASAPGGYWVMDITSKGCAIDYVGPGCGESVGDTRVVTTGWQNLKVSTTLAAVNITVLGAPFTGTGNVTKRHTRQMNGDPFSGGDSGATVYTSNKAHGIFFGGNGTSSFFSHVRWAEDYCGNCAVQLIN